MRVDLFDFDLPPDRIALRPAVPREAARLMQVAPQGVSDHVVADLPELLRAGDVMVVNDTKVIPARLKGRRGEAKIEATLHQRLGPQRWAAFARPAKRLKPGDRVEFGAGLAAIVAERREAGEVVLDFETAGGELLTRLDEVGEMPLPPYIAAKRAVDARDREDYQTVMASEPGAVAAPTAGLHLTRPLIEQLEAAGVEIVRITLHVGAGTFLPVKVDDTEDHRMHAETGTITADAARRINEARAAGGRLAAVGTTSLRLLESASDEAGRVHPFEGSTDIFITPGHRFRSADLLMTNFHLPRSTLFMLVAAFSGLERMRGAYARAIRSGYRFYSYGDAMLLHRMAP